MASFNQSGTGIWAEQDKDAVLDYGLDWSDMLLAGDGIATSTWICTDPALVLSNQALSGSNAVVWLSGGVPGTWYTLVNTVTTTAGRRDQRKVRLFIKNSDVDSPLGSALFPNKFTAIAKMKRDRLMLAATAALPDVAIDDEYIWDKLRAAEAEVGRILRVPLGPTTFFPAQPTAEQLEALAGGAWAIDPGYDYEPGSFSAGDKWGMIRLRNKPLISVDLVRFAYPGGNGSHYDLPLDWLRMDRRAGSIQFVPSSTAVAAPLNAFVMQAIGNGRTIPLAIQLTYTAGLMNAAADFPELVDAVMKTATLKILSDAFLPQSGSISADGLSQSMSMDLDKHHDAIEQVLDNLASSIHGIRVGFMGG